MNSLVFRFFVLLIIALATLGPMNSRATALADSDVQEIQRTIAVQLAAFAQDDAEGAFGTATPAVQQAMGTSTRFMALVRSAYPMVYRPRSVAFLKPEQKHDDVLQLVQITDRKSKSWLALFKLERQPDSSWRISGCAVSENRWLST